MTSGGKLSFVRPMCGLRAYRFWAVGPLLVALEGVPAVLASPFSPVEQTVASAPAGEPPPLEFRGLVVMGGKTQYNFLVRAKNLNAWVTSDRRVDGIQVKSYDKNNDSVVVDFEGRSFTLTMEKSKIASAPSVMPATASVAAANAAAPVPPPPVVLNPSPADEQKRLEAIAAEVRRRRALRQQGGPPGTQ